MRRADIGVEVRRPVPFGGAVVPCLQRAPLRDPAPVAGLDRAPRLLTLKWLKYIFYFLKTKREKALGVNERPWRGYPIQKNSAACGPLVRARVCAMELMR